MKEANQILALLSNVNHKMALPDSLCVPSMQTEELKRLNNGDCRTFMLDTTADL